MQTLQPPDVILDEFDLEHECITLEEIRWMLRKIGFLTPYWMYFVIRATTGIRPDEALKLTLYHLSPGLQGFNYCVDKASTRAVKGHGQLRKRKHRRVMLDPWVREMLVLYLNRTCRVVNGEYISPYPNQQLFPWVDRVNPLTGKIVSATAIVGAYWSKLRKKMLLAGFDSMRIKRRYTKRQANTPKGRMVEETYVIRPHILRHFYASIMYVKYGFDIKKVMEDIKHNDVETTNGYVHSPSSLGTTAEYLLKASFAEILGYDPQQGILPSASVTAQLPLDCF
jgi:integrase